MYKYNITISLIIILLLSACGTTGEGNNDKDSGTRKLEKVTPATVMLPDEWESYTSEEFNLKLNYPANWKVEEFTFGDDQKIINVFPSGQEGSLDLPVTIHADGQIPFLGIYPRGYGTDLPMGRSDWLREEIVSFPIREDESKVFMLENDQTWGYFIVPSLAPAGWNNGFIFAQIGVENFKARCFDKETDGELSMEDCDPMLGDKIKRYGEVDNDARKIIENILQSIGFSSNEKKVRNKKSRGGEGIKVQQPTKGATISSPLEITGEARGNWFFEAEFTIQLVKDGKTLSDTIARARGEWMTEDFVPFNATLFFPGVREKGEAVLVFNNSNPSGKPELNKTYKVPVVLE